MYAFGRFSVNIHFSMVQHGSAWIASRVWVTRDETWVFLNESVPEIASERIVGLVLLLPEVSGFSNVSGTASGIATAEKGVLQVSFVNCVFPDQRFFQTVRFLCNLPEAAWFKFTRGNS
jgi:hypothetical protein